MDEWYTKLRNLKDESERPYVTQSFAYRVFHDLSRSKIREKAKFRERTGREFELWALKLEGDFPQVLVREILNDDEFWTLTTDLLIQ